MPRRSALLIHDDSSAVAREEGSTLAHDGGDAGDVALSWLFPWLLAITGILITLALIR